MKNLSKTIVALGIASFATIAQAKSDINIWNWSDYIGENTVADFEKASGLKANYAVFDEFKVKYLDEINLQSSSENITINWCIGYCIWRIFRYRI